jgi:hypothetical protein
LKKRGTPAKGASMSADDEQGSVEWRMTSSQRNCTCEHVIAEGRPNKRETREGVPSFGNSLKRWNKKPMRSGGFTGKRR